MREGTVHPDDPAAPLAEAGIILNMTTLVERVRDGDHEAMAVLYETLIRGIRHYMCRQLPYDTLDDRAHNVFVITVSAIRNGQLRDPERLPGFVRTVGQRQAAEGIRDRELERAALNIDLSQPIPLPDHRCGPEKLAMQKERCARLVTALRALPARDRELLTRFYLDEQTQEEICEQMDLTPNQFRLMKSRAKSRLGEIGRRQARPALRRRFAAAS